MTTQTTSRNTSGIILILVGLALFATQFMQGRSPEIFVFSVSAAFLAAYLLRRNIGLLIPGGILFGVGLSMLGGQWASAWGDFGGIGLGLGFISIYVISLLVERRSHWWPLLPGAALILSGLATSNPSAAQFLAVGWPMILVLIGLVVLIKTRVHY